MKSASPVMQWRSKNSQLRVRRPPIQSKKYLQHGQRQRRGHRWQRVRMGCVRSAVHFVPKFPREQSQRDPVVLLAWLHMVASTRTTLHIASTAHLIVLLDPPTHTFESSPMKENTYLRRCEAGHFFLCTLHHLGLDLLDDARHIRQPRLTKSFLSAGDKESF